MIPLLSFHPNHPRGWAPTQGLQSWDVMWDQIYTSAGLVCSRGQQLGWTQVPWGQGRKTTLQSCGSEYKIRTWVGLHKVKQDATDIKVQTGSFKSSLPTPSLATQAIFLMVSCTILMCKSPDRYDRTNTLFLVMTNLNFEMRAAPTAQRGRTHFAWVIMHSAQQSYCTRWVI